MERKWCFVKKVVSLLLALIVTVTGVSVPLSVNAEEPAAQTQTEISAKGTNAFGNLLADAMDEKLSEQTTNNGYNVFAVEMEDNLAVVSLETLEDCTLVVGVYDEAGEQMLASGHLDVMKGETDAVVEIETDEMPDYYYLRAFLVDSVNFQPLCVAYESPNYTWEMQEFLAKTADDFDAERVLNLDEDETNNFAVYKEETTIIRENGDTNTVVRPEEEQSVYVFENADSAITSLLPGDVFAYECADGEVLLIKVAAITLNGTTATITGGDTSMEEVFDYVKIDAAAGIAQAEIDPSTCGEGVTYTGLADYVDEDAPQTYALDMGGSATYQAASFRFADVQWGAAKLSGGLDFKLEAGVKVYISWSYQYLELKLEYAARIHFSLSGKGENKLPLAYVCLSPVAGVIVELVPCVALKTDVTAELSATLKGTAGFRMSNTAGGQNLTSTPSLKPTEKVEGTVFAGFVLEPKIKVICDELARVSMMAEVGGEITGVLKNGEQESTEAVRHACRGCIDGDISGKVNLTVDAKIINRDNLMVHFDVLNNITEIGNFYFSYDYGDFGLTICPHKTYKVTLMVLDTSMKAVPGAVVKGEYTTDIGGKAVLFLPSGEYYLPITKGGYQDAVAHLTVDHVPTSEIVYIYAHPDDGADHTGVQTMSVGLTVSAAITTDGSLYTWGYDYYGTLGDGTLRRRTPGKIMDHVVSVSLGDEHGAAITTDGSLYMWGRNDYGQLGDGTTVRQHTPVKIMEDVASVSLGWLHSAAITMDGSLYVWGMNWYGQLGNGVADEEVHPVPIKIMDHVVSVSLGLRHSAAVTTDGSLYVWGGNQYGQLGDGTEDEAVHPTPVKIMDSVAAVSLGRYHSAAITTDGSLYTWGDNSEGQLGNGTTANRGAAVKIMGNIASVSLGSWHSAAVTTDGSLYMWGANHAGQLGDGTTASQADPIKIMDNVALASSGFQHSAAVTVDGSLYMWGDNVEGQLGDGSTERKYTPVKIMDNILLPGQTLLKTSSNQVSRLAAKATTARPASFTDLTPGGVYNVYAMKNREADDPLGADNLLYINQLTADENGCLSADVAMDEEYATPDVFVVGMAQANPALLGDLNDDGFITASDALMALQAATNKITLSDEHKKAADVDGQVGVSANDALLILQYATKKIAVFPAA